MLGDEEEGDESAVAACLALGAFELAVAPLTETEPRGDAAIPDIGQKARQVVKRATRGKSRRTTASASR
jgi:hypothetical protein